MRLLTIGLAALMCLSACGGGGGGSGPAQEKINGVQVPPQPEATANIATVAGVDSDTNGIRDDIDRKIATDFGAVQAQHTAAVSHAKSLQKAITSVSTANSSAHVLAVSCSDTAALKRHKTITTATLDSPARRAAYAEAFAGSVISLEGC
jgi:hypothetical protein